MIEEQLSAFRRSCEEHCQREIEARIVFLASHGSHIELQKSLTSCRLYQNLTAAAPCMAVYDVKNAKLCKVGAGENPLCSEPLLDEADFERFVATAHPLLAVGRDILWVFAGRATSNLPKIKKVLRNFKMRSAEFALIYSSQKMQQYGYWQRQRGLARSNNIETLLLVFKDKVPAGMPLTRMYVDAGSRLFLTTVRNVPVLAPTLQALVSREVRDTSLAAMHGEPQANEGAPAEETLDGLHQPEEEELPEPDPAKALVAAHVKKRKLYRQLTGDEVPWFPHDNAPSS